MNSMEPQSLATMTSVDLMIALTWSPSWSSSASAESLVMAAVTSWPPGRYDNAEAQDHDDHGRHHRTVIHLGDDAVQLVSCAQSHGHNRTP